MNASSVVAVSLVAAVGLAAVALVGIRTRTLAPSLVAFAVHLLAALLIFSRIGLWSPDAIYYDKTATDLLQGTTERAITAGKEGWPYLLAGLYQWYGHIPALGLVVNATAAALTVAVLARLAVRLRLPENPTAWIAALLPSAMLWSSLLLRESLTWFFLSLCTLGFAGIALRRNLWSHIFFLVPALGGLLFIRGTAAILVAVAGVLAVAIVRKQWLLLAALIAAGLAVSFGPLRKIVLGILGSYSLDQISASREALARTATTAFPAGDLSNPYGIVQEAFGLVARVLFGPLPWEWHSVGIPFVLDAILWLTLLCLAICGWVRSSNKRELLIIVLPVLALLVSLAITSGNYGTMQRLRVQAEVLMIPLVAAGTVRRLRGASEVALKRPALSPDRGNRIGKIV